MTPDSPSDDDRLPDAAAIAAGIEHWLGNGGLGYDYVRMSKLLATVDTARFFQHHMLTAQMHGTRYGHHAAALKARRIGGLVLEFGVAAGRSINFIAERIPDERIYGFDGFEGLPEDWIGKFRAGTFAQPVPEVASNVELVVGWFEETLPPFLQAHPGDISYLHVDCDLYSSTRTILEAAGERIRPGTVIVFDDYFNYPGWQEHEHKAFMEFVEARRAAFHYIGGVRRGTQVSVVIDGIG